MTTRCYGLRAVLGQNFNKNRVEKVSFSARFFNVFIPFHYALMVSYNDDAQCIYMLERQKRLIYMRRKSVAERGVIVHLLLNNVLNFTKEEIENSK